MSRFSYTVTYTVDGEVEAENHDEAANAAMDDAWDALQIGGGGVNCDLDLVRLSDD